MTKKSWRILPVTSLGWWSIGCIVAAPILFTIGGSLTNLLYESTPAGGTLFADIAARPALALTMLTGMAAGISAFITGVLSLIRLKERGIMVYISCIIGGLFTFALTLVFLGPE